jgi:RNA polymerase primary sigma factor
VSDEAFWLQQLKALGQSQGFLTYAQVNESMPVAIVDPEKIDEIVEQLKRAGIRVLPTAN